MAGRTADEVALDLGVRPLNARSIVLSALLGTHPPELPVAALVGLGTTFGIPDGTLRTALSRMVTAGEVMASGGRYRLAGRMVDRQREQDTGRSGPDTVWDGTWWTATAAGDRRPAPDRRRFRARMAGARMGELRPGAWMRPANIGVSIELPDVLVLRGTVEEGDPAALVHRLWDLDATEARARQLGTTLAEWRAALDTDEGDAPIAPAFTTFAACLQYLRTEPQLPNELAPSPAARALRRDYREAEPHLQARLREIYRRTIGDAER